MGLGLVAGGYAACVAAGWWRFGRPNPPAADEADGWLDRFIPQYDVAERFRVRIGAPAEVTLTAATEMSLEDSAVIRGIIRARALVLGATPDTTTRPRGLLAQSLSLGWGLLAEDPGREIVMGAVTQPWRGNVVFRAIPPDLFADFHEPDFVKIVWTLRADSLSPTASIFRTETRAMTTDAGARRKFRWYWARFSPGIVLIRILTLRMLKAEAERRAS